jgi:glutathione synthase/RimK-type ligase-like ATP-grasp enzyme
VSVVLVGSAEDDHVRALDRRLREMGTEPYVLDSLRFPEAPRLALRHPMEDVFAGEVSLGVPRAVYVRGLYLSPVAFGVDLTKEMDEDWRTTLVILREKAEMMVGLMQRWEELGVPLYNALSAADRTRKPYQIARLARAGLPVPDTLWSNDPEAVRAFARAHGRVADKPVAGGAATRELSEDDLDQERLDALANAAVTFQELLPGQDYRVFVVDGRVVAAYRIVASGLDYRQNEEKVDSIELDDATRAMCLRAAEVLGLRFTGMDLKGAADGSLRILELNASPMFLGFDALGGTDVLGELARALASR